MICTETNKSAELFQQAMECFETTLDAGMRLHEETVQRCISVLRDAGSPLDWERTVPGRVNKAIAAMQQHVDQSIREMNENARQTMELMGTGRQMHEMNFDASEEDSEIWNYALNAMRANERIIRQANARVLESCGELAKGAAHRVAVVR